MKFAVVERPKEWNSCGMMYRICNDDNLLFLFSEFLVFVIHVIGGRKAIRSSMRNRESYFLFFFEYIKFSAHELLWEEQ